MKNLKSADPSSFRDSSGFVFLCNNSVFRQINQTYQQHYEHLISSGLYDDLVKSGLLIPHQEVEDITSTNTACYKIIKPKKVSFISYPYEWCFGQLKSAALTTLEIQKRAFQFGMTLKDCSAFNIQFRKGKPVFIDTLSFEIYESGKPWVPYRQFCQHFLAPLMLMKHVSNDFSKTTRVHLDGIPLAVASSSLPARTLLNPSILAHIHLHGKADNLATTGLPKSKTAVSRAAITALTDHLHKTVEKLNLPRAKTAWTDYYQHNNYSKDAFHAKKAIVAELINEIDTPPKVAWDLGGNTGTFSRILTSMGIDTISFDRDVTTVEENYQQCIRNQEDRILPLVMDLTNPSPGIGWQNTERKALHERGPADVALALALVHHLVITENTPFRKVAEFLSQICRWLIIEFVPKDDPQAQRLLTNKAHDYQNYNKHNFETEFAHEFKIVNNKTIHSSNRTIYLMKRRTR